MSGEPSRAVYTAVLGDYEPLNEQPVRPESTLRFICFTDSPDLESDGTWEVHRVEPRLPADPVRSARHLKISGHPLLDEFDETLWMDNSVQLRVTPEVLLDEWLGDDDLAVPVHGFRERLVDEFSAVVEAGYDDPGRVYEQLRHYLLLCPDVLDERPLFTALLARRRSPAVTALCDRWATDVLRYSRRDQLSLPPALARTPELRWRRIDIDTWSSPFHVWPVTGPRRRTGPTRSHTEAIQPIALRLRALEEEAVAGARRADELAAEVAALREHVDGLRELLRHREQELDRIGGEAAHWHLVADEALRHIDAMEASTTWRVGSAVARLRPPLGRKGGS